MSAAVRMPLAAPAEACRASLRARMEAAVELLIAALDALDEADGHEEEHDGIEPDADFEEDESGIGDTDGLLEQCGHLYPNGAGTVAEYAKFVE